MKKKALKNKNSKTAVIFPNWAVDSPDMFLHCARIPDVMVHIVKIREIYRRYKMSAPAYLFGFPLKKGFSTSVGSPSASTIRHLNVMSFAVSLGLYDRFLRLNGAPDLLIGGSPALLVSAKVKNYEKTLIRMICEENKDLDSIRIYQNMSERSAGALLGVNAVSRFSLLYFSRTVGKDTWQNILKEQKIHRLISLTCSLSKRRKTSATGSLPLEGLIETDPQLNWFWPLLKTNQSKGKIVSPTFPVRAGFL